MIARAALAAALAAGTLVMLPASAGPAVRSGVEPSMVHLPSQLALSGAAISGMPPEGAPPSGTYVTAPVQVVNAPVLRLAGRFPVTGSGTFVYARSSGPVLGRAGTLRRFRVAVERGISEDVMAFAAIVDAALADPRSWTASGRLRLQRVAPGAPYDFTIYLAAAGTARRRCAAGGVDIRVGGRPYTSCRTMGKVIINLDRWHMSVPEYVSRGVPLDTYRRYVTNHEVGHQLGHRHEGCPQAGRPAPVMLTQTLGLRGCTPYPWPYLAGRRYAGPRV
jgi:hypothetical protein